MKLYIIRHGETDWNKVKRIQGNTDIPLNAYGEELARITAEGLKDTRFDYIFSSPLKRAYKTAEIIRGTRPIEIVTDDRLVEMSFGSYEGTTKDERPADCELGTFFKHPELYVPDNDAETIDSIVARAGEFLDEKVYPLESVNPDCNILIAGHGALNKALMTCLIHLERKDYWGGAVQKNCSIAIYDIMDGQATLLEDGVVYCE
ncbi:MAG: histidine phosphatase family protein [Lachnospiraceae bacterium]|nr:histidine phosphatase family protein [Lachnospiraceae bacterium]